MLHCDELILQATMRIAVNTKLLPGHTPEGYETFLHETFSRLVRKYPEHDFIFINDNQSDAPFQPASNVSSINTGVLKNHPLLWRLWYEIKLPALLRKQKTDLLVALNGICSLTVKTKQCLIVQNLDHVHFSDLFSKRNRLFYKWYAKRSLKKAKCIATFSNALKKEIHERFKIHDEKIDLIFPASDQIHQPLEFDQRQEMKAKFTGGSEFFIYVGAIHPQKNIINLLKAFSVFKKRQKSGMKMILAGAIDKHSGSLVESLKTYKYRDDIILIDQIGRDELARLLASAYTYINPSLYEGFDAFVLNAMSCNVPVITTPAKEFTEGAALLADPKDVDALAEKMMLVYKDENLRFSLIKKGEKFKNQFEWDQAADILWTCIEKTIR